MKINFGKHKGKELGELNLQQLMGLRGAMQAMNGYRQGPFIDAVNKEIQAKQVLSQGKKPKKRRRNVPITEKAVAPKSKRSCKVSYGTFVGRSLSELPFHCLHELRRELERSGEAFERLNLESLYSSVNTEIQDRERFSNSLRSRTDKQLVRLKEEMQAANQLVLVGMIRDEVQRRVAAIQAEETWMTSERGRARDKHHLGKFYSEEVPETKRA